MNILETLAKSAQEEADKRKQEVSLEELVKKVNDFDVSATRS